jgi:general secretion pathway protein N
MADARPHLGTLALAALAGWAAVTALVAYTGLGGRYALHPDDPGLAAPLPQINLARAESRLGPIEDYAVIGQRPLFNADRQPLPDDAAGATDEEAVEEASQPLDVTLTGVILSGDVKIALLADNKSKETQSVRLGANLEGEQSSWKLAQLEPRRAVFEGPTGRTEVELRVFDGTGGQSPTPLERTQEGQPEAARPEAGGEGQDGEAPAEEMTPETRAEMIRRRIEERRRQMREEAARANQEGG